MTGARTTAAPSPAVPDDSVADRVAALGIPSPAAGGPCPCWYGPVSLHGGHCCFGPEVKDRCPPHDRDGMRVVLVLRKG